MQVTVEDVNSVKKKLHIEVPQDEVAQELNKAYNQLKKTAKIKGFRPGKVPRSVLERMFKKDVNADVSSRLIQSSFVDAIKETDLRIVGNPQLDPPELDAQQPYNYDAVVEISPEIDTVDYSGLTLKRTNYSVKDEEIDAQLKLLQNNFAQHQKIAEDRPAQEGDFALIDYEGFRDGQPFEEVAKTPNYTLKIGDGIILKEFDDQLIGLNPGDSKEFNVTFPEDYFNKNLANLEISFQVTLNEIREEVLPEINDELAKKTGNYETLDDLKNMISDNLAQGYKKRVEHELNEQIFQSLIEQTEFEVPETLVDMELKGILEEAERSFANRNTSMEELGLTRDKIEEKYRDTAYDQVKRHLILGKLIDQEELAISDDELEDAFKEMADNFNQPIEEINKYYEKNKDQIPYLKHTLLEKKAINLIIDKSEIEDVEPESVEDVESESAEENAKSE